jgi:hypothetical protein
MHFDLFNYTLLHSYTVCTNNISLTEKSREHTKTFPCQSGEPNNADFELLPWRNATLPLIIIVVLTKATNCLTSKGQ